MSRVPASAPFPSRRATFPCLRPNAIRNGVNSSLSCAIASAPCSKSTQATAAPPHRSARCSAAVDLSSSRRAVASAPFSRRIRTGRCCALMRRRRAREVYADYFCVGSGRTPDVVGSTCPLSGHSRWRRARDSRGMWVASTRPHRGA